MSAKSTHPHRVSPTRDGRHLPSQDWRASKLCRFFQMGSCTKGKSCPFSHDTSQLNPPVLDPRELKKVSTIDTPTASPGVSKAICKFFRTGSCMYGAKCLFLHAEEEVIAQDAVTGPLENESKKDDFTRTIGGAFVQFDAGAHVSKIRLPSDFSAAHVSGLQPNTSQQAVRDMLAEKGLDINVDDIYILHKEGSYGATVRSDDPSFSKRLCTLVPAGSTWRGAKIYATPIAAPMPSGHNTRRVDCKKVHISWHKAAKNAWLNFGSGDIAQRVSDMFSKGAYEVLGQKVTAAAATRAGSVRFPRLTSRNHVAWTVLLTEVPVDAQEHDISQAIRHGGNKPRHIEMGTPTYSTNADEASAVVRSLLTNIGLLEYWEVTLDTNARRVKATARFLDESDARRAVRELDKEELPFHRKARLTVQIVYSAKFKVGSNIYDAVQPQIFPRQKTWKDKNISFRAYPSTDPLRRFRILKIEGESAENVAGAKTELEFILAGVVATEGDVILWDSSLKANGKLYQAMKALEKELSVIMVRDKVKSELRLFGTQRRCEEAQPRLAKLIRTESLATSTRVIELDPHKFFWACSGGFRKIAGRLGSDKASFDIISTPKRIIISGPLEDYDLALAIVEGRNQVTGLFEQLGSDVTRQECSVCWTEADTPIKTSCGHIYCLECFERSCTLADMAVAESAVLCHGNQGNCKSIIAVEDLQEHLSSAKLEGVLEQSFSSYVKSNPNDFRYCPSPDCDYIYRVTSDSKTQSCSNCFRQTCSACHESHEGISCADHRDLKSGGYAVFLKLKKELGIKDCPNCKTPLEKISGCNHMTCAACKFHICWTCLKTFSNGASVYQHMEECHGGHIDLPDL